MRSGSPLSELTLDRQYRQKLQPRSSHETGARLLCESLLPPVLVPIEPYELTGRIELDLVSAPGSRDR